MAIGMPSFRNVPKVSGMMNVPFTRSTRSGRNPKAACRNALFLSRAPHARRARLRRVSRRPTRDLSQGDKSARSGSALYLSTRHPSSRNARSRDVSRRRSPDRPYRRTILWVPRAASTTSSCNPGAHISVDRFPRVPYVARSVGSLRSRTTRCPTHTDTQHSVVLLKESLASRFKRVPLDSSLARPATHSPPERGRLQELGHSVP